MPSPEWKSVTAADGETQVRARVNESGSITIMLNVGAVSIRAAVTADDVAFLFKPNPEART